MLEMNTHAPQSIQTMSELMDFASVPYHILTPKDAKPIIEVIQDTMVGSYRLTKAHTRLHEKTFANLQMVNSYFSGILEATEGTHHTFTGRQAFSAILPPLLHINTTNKAKEKVIITNSKLLDGFIDKNVFSDMSRGLLPVIFHDYGPFEVRRFLDNLQRLVCRWLMTGGFSVGISDLAVSEEINVELKAVIANMKADAYKRLDDVRRGNMENTSMFNNHDYFEREIINILNDSMKKAGSIGLRTIDDKWNRLINMVKSGSKGKDLNVSQMIAAVGQQNVDGKRVAYGFTDRTLPHFCKYDDGPESRGFVESSFISGLTPQEMFFHAMGGREGLIDTAVKTSETGYIQRRLIKAMEDAKIYYDQTVRNAAGSIMQFIYGEDGMEGTKIEKQVMPTMHKNIFELDREYHLRTTDPLEAYLTDDAMAAMKKEGNWSKRAEEHFETLVEDRRMLLEVVFGGEKRNNIFYPIPFERILKNAHERSKVVGIADAPTDLTPTVVFDAIDSLTESMKVSKADQGTLYAKMLVRSFLSPKPLIVGLRLKKNVFEWVVEEVKRYFKEAIAPAGEMVGIIAAQSLGETQTQLSAAKDTLVRCDKFAGKIGDFIDGLLKKNSADVVDLGNDSVVLDLKQGVEDHHIIGVSNDEKTSWHRIKQVSRHPANGGMVKVTTLSGRTTCATLSHSFLKRTSTGIEPVLGSDLKVGDRVPVARNIPTAPEPIMSKKLGDNTYALDKEFGWFIGAYLADGCAHSNVQISKIEPEFEEFLQEFSQKHGFTLTIETIVKKGFADDPRYIEREYESTTLTIGGTGSYSFARHMNAEFGTGSYNKSLPAWVYQGSVEFIQGIVAGYFDGDGNVHSLRQMIRAHSVSERLVDDMIVLLAYCGIYACKTQEFRKREKANHFYVIQVCRKYAQLFQETIGFKIAHKRESLEALVALHDKEIEHYDKIDLIPEIGGLLGDCGRTLGLLSREFGVWERRGSALGRLALKRKIDIIEKANANRQFENVNRNLVLLKQAVNSHVVWDEIIKLEILPDPQEYVYDFTVPGNDSFMVDTCVLVHNTLDSFHVSGTAAAVKATSGVPRIKELLSVSKNMKTPSLTIYLKPDIGTVDNPTETDSEGIHADPRVREAKERAMQVLRSLETTRLENVIESTEIYYDPAGARAGFASTIPEDRQWLESYNEFAEIMPQCGGGAASPWVLRMRIHRAKLHAARLTMTDIYLRLMAGNPGITCLFSDDNARELVMRVSLNDNDSKQDASYDQVAALKALEQTLIHKPIKGMERIRKVSMHAKSQEQYNPATQGFDKQAIWVLDTDGSNLAEILGNPNVDNTRTISNDPREIYAVLGVEAARNSLYLEIMEVIKESSVNYRHVSLLIDTMTHRGNLMSIDRHGINRGDVGPLAKSSFEETTDMLINASVFSDYDKINGVSANIMLGQLPPCGTGDSEILLDEEMYLSMLSGRKELNVIKEEDEDESEAPAQDSGVCGYSSFQFNYKPIQKQNVGNAFKLPEVSF
jgi:DNA-directed RNA polymerase beta' subunit